MSVKNLLSRLLKPLVLVFMVSLSGTVLGDSLDFENAADYGGDDAVITDSYFENYGLSFTAFAGKKESSASQVALQFEAVGRDGTDVFNASGGGWDSPKTGNEMGSFFLKAPDALSHGNVKYFQMDIDFSDPTQSASGEIWDIDGPEQYTVTAYDSNGNQIASLTSPTGGQGLDGQAWIWAFDAEDNGKIAKVSIEHSGKGTFRGFAFDNLQFSQSQHAAPVPSALPLGAVGLLGLFLMRRRPK